MTRSTAQFLGGSLGVGFSAILGLTIVPPPCYMIVIFLGIVFWFIGSFFGGISYDLTHPTSKL